MRNSLISLMTRMIRVTLVALVVFAMSIDFPVVSKSLPYFIRGYQIQPHSGNIVTVDMISNQKKKLLRYPSITILASTISIV